MGSMKIASHTDTLMATPKKGGIEALYIYFIGQFG